MNIREATLRDIPKIIPVLKASLGEKDLPLSEEIWNFKHVENPFGKSLVLIAVENDEIIGVRAFMRWELYKEGKKYNCFRAVDTATHPKHQGKGVFKKLTLKAVEIAKEQKDDFIFNFPNEKSRPGYLKMGWKKAGELEVALKPSFTSFWKFYKNPINYSVEYKVSPKDLDKLCYKWNKKIENRNGLYTKKSHQYLEWRFEKNPLLQYEVLATKDFYLSGCLKNRKGIKELRITECIYWNIDSLKEVKKGINRWACKFGVQFISFSPKLLTMLSYKGQIGPILTVKDLNLRSDEKDSFLEIKNWQYSLGDLELF
ncbi:MAG: GNAT family N-acetyltransferase [Salegentibacter mishustinae]|nr:GNAT family N-acetyltransferase [Salegentibacter mishustinae]